LLCAAALQASLAAPSPVRYTHAGTISRSTARVLYLRVPGHQGTAYWGPVNLAANLRHETVIQPSYNEVVIPAMLNIRRTSISSPGHPMSLAAAGPQGSLSGRTTSILVSAAPGVNPLSPQPSAGHDMFHVLCSMSGPQQSGRCVAVHTNVRITNRTSLHILVGDAATSSWGSASTGDLLGLGGHWTTGGAPLHTSPSSSGLSGVGGVSGYQGSSLAAAGGSAGAASSTPFASHATGGTSGAIPAASAPGSAFPASSSDKSMLRLGPSQQAWLPAPLLLRAAMPGVISLQALPGPGAVAHSDAWSLPIDLRALLAELGDAGSGLLGDGNDEDEQQPGLSGAKRVARPVRCRAWGTALREGSASGAAHAAHGAAVHVLLVAYQSERHKVGTSESSYTLVLSFAKCSRMQYILCQLNGARLARQTETSLCQRLACRGF
jgi:hypothetical protein